MMGLCVFLQPSIVSYYSYLYLFELTGETISSICSNNYVD